MNEHIIMNIINLLIFESENFYNIITFVFKIILTLNNMSEINYPYYDKFVT